MVAIEALYEPMAGLVFVAVMIFFLYNMLRSKAVIYNQDGTYQEVRIKSKQTQVDMGEDGGVYNLRANAYVKKLIFGILPITRIFFMFGCPEPISFHSGKPVYVTDDLKLPVYGVYQCPKCKNTTMKIVHRVGSGMLRTLMFETRTKNLGRPESPKFKMKYLVWIAIAAGVIFLIMAATSGMGTTPTGA